MERLYDCSMSKRITKTAPDVQLLQIGYSKFLPSFCWTQNEKRKVNSGCTPSTRYMVMHCGIRVPIFLLAKLLKKTKKEPFTGSFFFFFYASGQVKDEQSNIHGAKSLSATNHNRWKRNQKQNLGDEQTWYSFLETRGQYLKNKFSSCTQNKLI